MKFLEAGKKNLLNFILKTLSAITNQSFWEKMFFYSLKQMNFDNGGKLEESGELFVARYIRNKLKQELSITIFDVGANSGDYTKALANVFGSKAIVHSFEPSISAYSALLKNTGDIENLVPNNIGLSNKEKIQLLFSNVEGSRLSSLYQRNISHFGLEMNTTEEIKLSTVDAYCTKNNIEQIHFLKLDVEGHEFYALEGAKKMIENRKIDFIQFEFGGCNIDSRIFFLDFFTLLKANYRIYRILKNGLREIPLYRETCEIFIYANYLAIKKQ